MYDFGRVRRACFPASCDTDAWVGAEKAVSRRAPGPEHETQHSVSGSDVCPVGAVLLPINCEKGNGLAIEAHPLIVARADLVCRCRRPRRQDKNPSKRT